MAGALRIPGWEHPLDGAPNGACRPRRVVFHTAVSPRPARVATGSITLDGRGIQHRLANVASAANGAGNPTALAFECMDNAPVHARDIVPMNAAQIERCVEAVVYGYLEFGIPPIFSQDARPGTTGVFIHRAGIDGNFGGREFHGRVPGAELWSSSYGKECNTDQRARQVRDLVVPEARRRLGLIPGGFMSALTPDEQRQLFNSVNQLTHVLAAYYAHRRAQYGDQDEHLLGQGIADVEDVLGAYYVRRNEIAGDAADYPLGAAIADMHRMLVEVVGHVDTLETSAAAELARDNAAAARDAEMQQALAGLEPREQRIIAAIRDPENPATAYAVSSITGAVEVMLGALDLNVELTPETADSIVRGLVEAVPVAVRATVLSALGEAARREADALGASA